MDVDDFSGKTKAFEAWLTQAGVQLNSSVRIADLRGIGNGRGILAAKNISSGETLFTVPRTALLTAQNTSLTTTCPGLQDAPELGDPWTSLLLALLLETARPDSRWRPYLDILPMNADKFNTLMFWTDHELAELQASSVRDKIGKQGAEASFRRLLPLIMKDREAFGFASTQVSHIEQKLIERCHVLASLIMAYAFDVEIYPRASQPDEDGYVTDQEESDLPKAMVPLADLLNADATLNNARLFYEADGLLAMRAILNIKEGDEIFNDYGLLPSSELVRRYGYLTDNYAQFDIVDVPLALFLNHAHNTFGIKDDEIMLQLAEMCECDMEDVPDGFELSVADLDVLKTNDMDKIYEVFPVLQLMHKPNQTAEDSPSSERLASLAAVLRARLAQYVTTTEEDLTNLQNIKGGKTNRASMALKIRMGEKRILTGAIELLDNQRSEPPRKKQRR